MTEIKRRRAQIEGSNNSIANQVQDIIMLLEMKENNYNSKEQRAATALILVLISIDAIRLI